MYLTTPKNNQVMSSRKRRILNSYYSPSVIRLNKPEQQDV